MSARVLTSREERQQLLARAYQLRIAVIQMLEQAQSGHAAGALGLAEVFAVLYFRVLRHDPLRPDWPDRDRLVLSNGHVCPVLYASLAQAGYFPESDLAGLRRLNQHLQGHPSRLDTPGVENSSGPLGQGISQAVGMALAAQLDDRDTHIYCVTSDAEHNEGQTWEAVMLAAKYKLPNLTVLIDRNQIQIDGFTESVLPLDSLVAKYHAFNWRVLEVAGHDVEALVAGLHQARATFDRPMCLVVHTIPGKGVSFMENKPEWHGKAPTPKEAELALIELNEAYQRIREGNL